MPSSRPKFSQPVVRERANTIWRSVAIVALVACAALLWRTPQASSMRREGEVVCEPAPASARSSASGGRPRLASSAALSDLEAALERAGTVQARCTALARLAHNPELDDPAVARIASYTERRHPLELRACAASALGEAAAPSALDFLLGLARDNTPMVSEAALRAIAFRSDEAARKALLSLARTGARPGRVMAAIALAEAGAPEATTVLVELLEGAPLHERERLIIALGTTHDAKAIPILHKLLATGGRPLVHAVVAALGELGGEAATSTLIDLLTEQPNLAYSVASALARIGEGPARAALLAAAEGEGRHATSAAALQALQALSGDDVHAVMLRALASESPERASPAIEYFAAQGSEAGVAALERMVGSGPRHLSFQSLHALARIGGDEARDFVASVAEGEGPLAEAALGALTMLPEGSEEAKQIALEQLARGDRGGTSIQALQLIATDESDEARAALIAAADDEGPTSAHALMLLSQRSDEESRRALARIASSARSPEQQVQVLQALAQTGDAAMLGTVRASLRSEHASVRAQAVFAVGQIGGPGAEQALIAATRDQSPEVVSSATGMLAQLGTPAALESLEKVASSRHGQAAAQALGALASVAPSRAAPLAEQLVTGDPETRQAALMVAAGLPQATGARIFVSAFQHADPAVVSDALQQVYAIGLDAPHVREAVVALSLDVRKPEELRARAQQLLDGGSSLGHQQGMHMERAHRFRPH